MNAAGRGRGPAWLAALAGGLHALATFYWATGGTWLLATLGSRVLDAFEGRHWMLWPLGLGKLLLALAPLALLHSRFNRARLPRLALWCAAAALVVWGGANTTIGNLVLLGVLHPSGGFDRQAMVGARPALGSPVPGVGNRARCSPLAFSPQCDQS